MVKKYLEPIMANVGRQGEMRPVSHASPYSFSTQASVPPMTWLVRPAAWEERKAIHAVAKLSPFTKKWDQVYYLQKYFERGAIGVCVSAQLDQNILGFIMLHHLVRKPYSSLYYAGVSIPKIGLASSLVKWAWKQSPHDEYRLTVDEDNTKAQTFWAKCGFVKYGEKKVKDGHTVLEMKCSREEAAKRRLS